jgi:hypothetical protein
MVSIANPGVGAGRDFQEQSEAADRVVKAIESTRTTEGEGEQALQVATAAAERKAVLKEEEKR